MNKPRFIDSFDYDPKTGEYLTKGIAEYDEPADNYIVAPNSTLIIPPTDIPEFTVACFNVKTEQWDIKPDYRRKAVGDHYEGGKPYYNPEEYWWSAEHYMTTIGDKPEEMSWEKIERPAVCQTIVDLEDEISTAKQYLADTDYVHNVIAEQPETESKYAPVIAERKRVRATIDPKQTQVDTYKADLILQYGEEALNHLRD